MQETMCRMGRFSLQKCNQYYLQQRERNIKLLNCAERLDFIKIFSILRSLPNTQYLKVNIIVDKSMCSVYTIRFYLLVNINHEIYYVFLEINVIQVKKSCLNTPLLCISRISIYHQQITFMQIIRIILTYMYVYTYVLAQSRSQLKQY